MPQLLVFPETTLHKVQKRAIVTLPNELATVRCQCPSKTCPGIQVNGLGHEHQQLQRDVLGIGNAFIERMGVRGFHHIGSSLWLHGPFVSQELQNHLVDIGSSRWQDAERLDRRWAAAGFPGDTHPEEMLPMVYDQPRGSPLCDYYLYGWFSVPEKTVRTSASWAGDRSATEQISMQEASRR